MFKKLLAVSFATVGCFVATSHSYAESSSPTGLKHDSKVNLTPENFPQIHKLIRPQDNEWRHLKVKWLTDVVAARKTAAKEDKPIVICYTGGAGYNEPLGVC